MRKPVNVHSNTSAGAPEFRLNHQQNLELLRSSGSLESGNSTLISYLESVAPESVPLVQSPSTQLIFFVQRISPTASGQFVYSGTVEQGSVSTGDEIRISASGQTAKISRIVALDGSLNTASRGQAVTLTLDSEVNAACGDIISLAQQPLPMTDQFEATLVWMNEEEGLIGRSYDLELATQCASATIRTIKHNVNTLAHEAARTLAINDISICSVSLSKAIVCDSFELSRILGGFMLRDKVSRTTVAAGMIKHSLRRAANIHKQALSIDRSTREKQNGHKGRVIWFTGLSGSGKSTLANTLEVALHAQGYHTYILDGDNVRGGLNKDLGFTDADRVENIRRIAEVAKLMMDAGLIVMTAFISPFRREREMARELIGAENFVEVYVDTTLDVCEQRDIKGLYKKARAGLLPNLTGIGSAYEAPAKPDITVNGGNESIEETAEALLAQLPCL